MDRNILETNLWTVTLSEDQTYFGRCMVMLKRKCGSLADLTEEEMLDFLSIIKKYESVFKEKYGATMFNWTCLMNDFYKSVSPDPQIHWHSRSRYREPVLFEGTEFRDPNFAHHYEQRTNRELDDKTMEKLRDQLRSDLNK